MGRPPEHEKRRALAHEAVALMQREGLDVPMSRLAEALGLKRPTLLYHFPTKAQIVQTALEELMVEQARFVLERIESVDHPIDRLYAQVRAVHEFHHGREARILFLTQALAATGGAQMNAMVEGAARVFEAQRRANAARIRAGIEAGVVAPCDPEALVQLVRAIVDGLMFQRVTEGIDLAPIHALLWERVLAPLKLAPSLRPTEPAPPRPAEPLNDPQGALR
ncbi:MAG: TetR/AcrR family transcriptional regulator [Myxococcales bacterium]|nr:TetR/AcrR family transcriptional regulator [Myxococcales bacterium]